MRTLALLASIACLVLLVWLTVSYFQKLSTIDDLRNEVVDLERQIVDLEKQKEELTERRRGQSLAAVGLSPAVCDAITPHLSEVNFVDWSDERLARWFYEKYDVQPPSAGEVVLLESMTVEETLKALGAYTPTPEERKQEQQRQVVVAVVENRALIQSSCWPR